jgi:hypothetical protein
VIDEVGLIEQAILAIQGRDDLDARARALAVSNLQQALLWFVAATHGGDPLRAARAGL